MVYDNQNSLSADNISVQQASSSLQAVHELIASNLLLSSCVINVSCDDDVLVILCGRNQKKTIVKNAIQAHWDGNVEVYCPSDFMVGAV